MVGTPTEVGNPNGPDLTSTTTRQPPRLVHEFTFSMPPGTLPDKVHSVVRNFAREELGVLKAGELQVESGKAALMRTRYDVRRAWLAIGDALRRQGCHHPEQRQNLWPQKYWSAFGHKEHLNGIHSLRIPQSWTCCKPRAAKLRHSDASKGLSVLLMHTKFCDHICKRD